jgi:hypothetical protein
VTWRLSTGLFGNQKVSRHCWKQSNLYFPLQNAFSLMFNNTEGSHKNLPSDFGAGEIINEALS